MLKRLNVKNEYLLIGGALVLLMLSYHLAFRNTLEAWQLHQHLSKQLQSAGLNYRPAYEQARSRNLDQLLALYKADTINFRSNIITAISGIAEGENVKLSEVPIQDPFLHADKFIIQKLNFEGDYFSLVKVLNKLQSAPAIGVVRAATFRKMITYGSKGDASKLTLQVYLEMVR